MRRACVSKPPVYNQDSIYRAYEKRRRKALKGVDAKSEETFRDANSIEYGNAPRPAREAVENMVEDLVETWVRSLLMLTLQ